jgi:eukaryotic-like serine/threonine-protein kinase
MALPLADLAILSSLLDQALALPATDREAWLAALPADQQRHVAALRDMLTGEPDLHADRSFASLPTWNKDEAVANAGDLIGPYLLLQEIGRGGMGSVWLATKADGSLKRQVALKLPRLAWGAGLAKRMARERDIGALLEHPNIARLYDAGVDQRGRPFLALEYVNGQPIDAWCAAQALSVRERLRLLVQVARAVAYAHGRLVVHRDLKPSNVLVTPDGQAHLLDFGIAKLLDEATGGEPGLTQQQGRVLTPHYASPEQVAGEAITVQSDVYSLGVLLFELLTGSLPIVPKRKTAGAVEQAILEGDAPAASSRAKDALTAKALRGDVDAILAKAMQREPAQRYATADALAEDIERFLNGQTVVARPSSLAYRLRKALRRHRVGFAAGLAIIIAVLSGTGVSIVQAQRANAAAERARVVKEFVVGVFNVNARGSSANKYLRQLPAELLLEHGAKLIATKFSGQPALRAELFGVVASIFADIGANPLAADYAARQADLLASLGASAAERAQAAMLLAQVLFSDFRVTEALEQARHALTLAQDDAVLRPQALVLLVRVLRRQGNDAEALTMLERAERGIQSQPGPSLVGARAKSIRAAFLSNGGKFEQAFPLYDAAIAEAIAVEGPLSPVAVDIRLMVSRELAALARGSEAGKYHEAALTALRDTGGAADIRAAREESDLAGRLYQVQQMSFAEAQAAIERAQAVLATHGALVPDLIKATIDFDLAKLLVLRGDLKAVEPLLARSVPVLLRHIEGPQERFPLAAFQGLRAMYAGHHEESLAFFSESIELRVKLGTSRHMFAVQDYTNAALSLIMQGEFKRAAAMLDAAPIIEIPAGSQGPEAQYAALLPRMRARLALTAGNAPAALALLPPPTTDDWPPLFPYDDTLLRGEVLCAVGRRDEALPLLEKSLAWHQAAVHEHHPELARARAATGVCALASGQRKRALELANLARVAIEAQPGVGLYFTKPVDRLVALLGSRANALPARRGHTHTPAAPSARTSPVQASPRVPAAG